MTRVGLALGGGGIAGSAHLGVMLALEEAGISFHCVAGTSSGGIAAGLYACGYTIRELIDLVPRISKHDLDYDYSAMIRKLFLHKSKFQGLIKGVRLRQFLLDVTNGRTMKDIRFPVAILAADLKMARPVVFSSEDVAVDDMETDIIREIRIAEAIMASCSIPILFQPVHYAERVLVDGGLIDNCPATYARCLGAEKVIAVDLVATAPVQHSFPSLRSIAARVVTFNLALQSKQRVHQASIVLRPDVGEVGALEFSQILRCIDDGYEYTSKRIDQIKDIIRLPHPAVMVHV